MDISAPVSAPSPGNAPQVSSKQPLNPINGAKFQPQQQQPVPEPQTLESGQQKSQPKPKQAQQEEYFDVDGERLTKSEVLAEYKRRKDHIRAANDRFQQAKAESSKVDRLRDAATSGNSKEIRKILREFGADDMKVAQDIISEEYENVSMSPEQREMRRREADLEAREQKYKEQEQQEVTQKAQAQQKEFLSAITSEAVSAFEQLGHKPDPLTLSLFATQLMSGFDNTQSLTRADVYDAAKNVQQSEMRVTQKHILGVKEASQLRQRIGDQAYRHLKQIFEQEVTSRQPQLYSNNRPQQQSFGRNTQSAPAKPFTSQKELHRALGIAR